LLEQLVRDPRADFRLFTWGFDVSMPLIEAVHLSKDYLIGHSLVHAISDVSFTIKQGEFVAIRGRSGSGKSTLMSLLGLLERPASGQYFLDGKEVAALSERSRTAIRNRKIGFVFQLPMLLPRSDALQNVELPLAYAGIRGLERKQKAIDALDRVGLSHRCHHWPSQLSGGEQQRVAIARALIHNPTLLLADEPTGALDSHTSDEILSLFDALHREGSTIVIVTHAPDVAERAARRITLLDGRVIEDSSDPRQAPSLKVVASGKGRDR
jgi:putative ABC transport system ATP-binding protein